MAGKTISQLPLATTPLAGTESVPIVRSGVTYKTTVADVAKSPQDGATSYGVVYYDGNKMPASGSAFTFDGTNVAATGTVSVAKLIPTGSSVAGTGIYSPSSNAIAWSNNGVQTMQLDASGNLGLGVTPSAWGTYKAVQVGGVGWFIGGSAGLVGSNLYYDGSTYRYINSGNYAGYYNSNNTGGHSWHIAPSGTAGNAISFTQAMTLDVSGNLLVGRTSSSGKFCVDADTNTTSGNRVALFSSTYTGGDQNYEAVGVLKYSNISTGNVFVRFFINNGATGSGLIQSNGASTAAFATYSDARLKENIETLPSQLANICALRPVEFDYIESQGGGHQIGFIAQEMQEVYADAVTEGSDGMLTITGWDKTTARLVKAIQEQQAIIEQLTARVVALEAKQAA